MMPNRKVEKWIYFSYFLICGTFTRPKGTTAQTVGIYPSPRAETFISENLRLTCSNNGTGSATFNFWLLDTYQIGGVRKLDTTCTPYGNIENQTLYAVECTGNEAVTLTIKNIQLKQHGDVWSCSQTINSQAYQSNNTTVFVKVRVSSVTLSTPSSSTVTVHENTAITFSCTTSLSRPAPTVSWYIDGGTAATRDDSTILQTVSQSPAAGSEDYVSTTGSLSYKPSRTANGKYVFCQSKDDDGHNVFSNRKIRLNVTYKPDSGPVIHSYNNSMAYKAIANRQQILTCSVIGGNPIASLSWSCFTGSEADFSSGQNVSKRWTWTSSRDGTCKCISTHLGDSEEVVLNVKILSPPTSPEFQLRSQTIQGSNTVKVLNYSSAPITCSATSYPSPDKYTWKYNGQSTVSQVASLSPSQITADGRYSCQVKNTMTPTQGQVEYGNNSAYIDIEHLYAPSVTLFNVDPVVEGDTLSVQCKTVQGNPARTTYSWKRKLNSSSGNTWQDIPGSTVNGDQLQKQNINRNDAGTYRCTASNVMKPTAENQQVGSSWQSFILNVLYKASISRFFEVNHSTSNEVTLSENSSINLQCEVESNPGSTIDILKNGEIKTSKKNTKHITYSNSKVSCDTAGIYSCVGYNDHNTEVNKPYKDLRLFVTCSPRLTSPTDDFRRNISTALNEELQLKVTIVAYPVPKPSEYIWSKLNGNTWEILTNNDALKINTSGLESTLIIHSVKETDIQRYRVNVSNSFGQILQEFSLNLQDKPKPPENVKYVDGSLTETSAMITWNPGFDGGLDQTFVLQYRKQVDSTWLEVTKKDEGIENLNITLTGLAEGTTYVFQMYSKNSQGNSPVTEQLTFKTRKKCEKDNSAVIVGVVLGLVIVIVVTYAIYVTILLKRKHVNIQKEENTEHAGSQMYINLAIPRQSRANIMKRKTGKQVNRLTDEADSENQYTELDKELKVQESAYEAISSM